MGNRGRFGKYGETKRIDRLRQARKGISFQPVVKIESLKTDSYIKGRSNQKGQIRTRLAQACDLNFVIRLSGRVFDIWPLQRDDLSMD